MTVSGKLDFSHFLEMELLEKQFYDAEYITPAQEAFEWYKKYPYSVIAIQADDKIAGFINMFPISDSVFYKLKIGSFNDKNLTVNDIIDIDMPQNAPLHMFLSCIVTAKEYRNAGITKLLLKKAVEQYSHKKQLFDFILMDTVTASGNKFAQKYGFKPICSTDHGTTVYMQSYEDFAAKCEIMTFRHYEI